MNRLEHNRSFWEKQPTQMYSMFLNRHAEELDRLERPEILSYLPSWDGQSVLDLPTGIGRFITPFAEKAKEVVAVDLCSHFLEESQKRNQAHPNVRYLLSDAMDLSFPDASFDLIFISWLLQYLEDQEVTTLSSRLASWLRPGGHLFLRESCQPCRGRNPDPTYFAIYRTLLEYPLFFPSLTPIKEGNILAYEDLRADPFKCYWVFKKLP